MRALTGGINAWLDAAVRPRLRFPGGRSYPAFRVCGLTGLAVAVTLAVALVLQAGLSIAVLMAVTASAVATFLLLAVVTRLVMGEEELIYFHHEIAIMIAVSATVALLGQPVLPYLDVAALGIGTFLAFGRLGCFLVGCCHGRPGGLGACYRPEHGEAGFPVCYVGVRLFPVQIVEALVVGAITGVGVTLALGSAPPGTVVAWYVVAYDAARFGLESLRGDAARRYLWGVSEGQWTAVALTCAVVWGEQAGLLPSADWHRAVAAGLVLVALARSLSALMSPGGSRSVLLRSRHLREIAEYARAEHPGPAGSPLAPPRVVRTSCGLQLSSATTPGRGGPVEHFSLSLTDAPLQARVARPIGKFISRLRSASRPPVLLRGPAGVYHLLLP